MGYHITDTTGEITDGSIYLPKAGSVPIGGPVVGVSIEALQEELSSLYGARFTVALQTPEAEPKPEPKAGRKAD